jgi:PhnB protein
MADVQLSPYLSFPDGKTRSVIEFYKSVFGGELYVQTFGEFKHPDESKKDLVMHSRLTSDDVDIMASDAMDDSTLKVGNNVSLSLSGTNGDALKKYWAGLSEGGTVTDELSTKPWGDEFGMLTDKFGISWLINVTSAKNVQQ